MRCCRCLRSPKYYLFLKGKKGRKKIWMCLRCDVRTFLVRIEIRTYPKGGSFNV